MANEFKVRNAFIINDENGYWNVFVTGITNDSGLTTDSEYNLVTEWAIKRNVADALEVLNELSLSGLTDVDFSGLTEGQYLMFSGGTWINVDGSYIQPTYTNEEATPTTVGGVEAGSTFSAVTLQDMWTDLLYPYQSPSFTSFNRTLTPGASPSPQTVECGYTLSAGNHTFTWVVNEGKAGNANDDLIISDVTGGGNLATGLDWDDVPQVISTVLVYRDEPSTYTWKIEGTDTNTPPNTYSTTTALRWYWNFYYGESSLSSLTGSQILTFGTSALKNSVSLTHKFDGTLNYKYYCIPSTFTLTSVKDYLTGIAIGLAGPTDTPAGTYSSGPDSSQWYYNLVSVTNSYGVSQTYKVFRTRFKLDGDNGNPDSLKFVYT